MAKAATESASNKAEDGGKADVENGGPAPKKLKTSNDGDGDGDGDGVPLMEEVLDSTDILGRCEDFKREYDGAKPYPHCVLPNLFKSEFLEQVRKEIKDNSKVNFKESDLFKMYQSIDFANLSEEKHGKDMPAVMKLRKALYSDEWRAFIERVAGLDSGTLSGTEVDCACNCHSTTCHLLCHDDVIKTRKISYILYLTDDPPSWESGEGGALELYGSTVDPKTKQRIPESIPCKQTLPLFNHMAFFKVDPGFSFHAVQEVIGDRPRLSLQGWYHASTEPNNIQDATLQRLKAVRKKDSSHDTEDEAFEAYSDESPSSEAKQMDEEGKDAAVAAGSRTDQEDLSEADRKYLSQYLDETYLKPEALKEMKECFEDESSIQLRHFLQDKWVDRLSKATGKEDADQLSIDHPDFHKQGVSDSWELVGPSHMQRFLQYGGKEAETESPESAGELLQHLRTKVLESQPFRRFLKVITSLGTATGYRGKIRRFRPGRDYTVAHYGLLTEKSVLDATLCFAAGTGILPPPAKDEGDEGEKQEKKSPSAPVNKAGADDLPDEADLLWQSGDVGGFECYIAADDDGDEANGGKDSTPDESYNAEDDTELLSISASNNTLSLVYRDPGTMRFVKYVSQKAPSSRWDVSMEYQVEDTGDEDEDKVV